MGDAGDYTKLHKLAITGSELPENPSVLLTPVSSRGQDEADGQPPRDPRGHRLGPDRSRPRHRNHFLDHLHLSAEVRGGSVSNPEPEPS